MKFIIGIFFIILIQANAMPLNQTDGSDDLNMDYSDDLTSALPTQMRPPGGLNMEYSDNNFTILGKEIDIPCTNDTECGKHGVCVEGYCSCGSKYASTKEDKPCEYPRRSAITGFLWAFFLGGFGANWFYLARGNTLYIVIGVIKLCLLGLGWNKSKTTEQYHDINTGRTTTVTTNKEFLPIGTWWFVDWLLILLYAFPDGKGVEMY